MLPVLSHHDRRAAGRVVCLLAALAAAAPAHGAGLPPLTGHVDAAFGAFADWVSDPEDVGSAGPSGFDVRAVWLQADPADGRLRFAVQVAFGAVAGDSDGDGDPDSSSDPAVFDAARLGAGEQLRAEFDVDDDGAPDLALRIGADGDLDDCALVALPDEPDDAPLAGCVVAPDAAGDLVLDVHGFVDAVEARRPSDMTTPALGLRVLFDSTHDAVEPDLVPQQGLYPLCPFQGWDERCDGIDNDCDGVIDEHVEPCAAPADEQPIDGPDLEQMGCSARPSGTPALPPWALVVAWGALRLCRRRASGASDRTGRRRAG